MVGTSQEEDCEVTGPIASAGDRQRGEMMPLSSKLIFPLLFDPGHVHLPQNAHIEIIQKDMFSW